MLPRCSENQFLRLCRVHRATIIAATKTGKRIVRVSCLLQQIWPNKSYHFSSHSRSLRWQADQWSCGWCRALRDFFVAFPIRSFSMSTFTWVLYQFNSFQIFYDFTTLISESLQRPVFQTSSLTIGLTFHRMPLFDCNFAELCLVPSFIKDVFGRIGGVLICLPWCNYFHYFEFSIISFVLRHLVLRLLCIFRIFFRRSPSRHDRARRVLLEFLVSLAMQIKCLICFRRCWVWTIQTLVVLKQGLHRFTARVLRFHVNFL